MVYNIVIFNSRHMEMVAETKELEKKFPNNLHISAYRGRTYPPGPSAVK